MLIKKGVVMSIKDLEWKTGKKEELCKCALFDLVSVERFSTDGRKGNFVEVDSKDWIVAIPWFRNKDGVPYFVMEEQFRHGSATVTREFPAGLVERGEEALGAAKRELLEETGLEGDFSLLGNVNPNSAFMANRQSFFFVENLRKVKGQSLDENEQIDVVEVPVAEAVRDMGTGLYDNGIMMMALGFFLRLAEKRPELREVTK